MKTYQSLFFASLLFLISCGDDSFSEEVVGSWDLVSVEISGCDELDNNITIQSTDTADCVETLSNIGMTYDVISNTSLGITFLKNGTATSFSTSFITNGRNVDDSILIYTLDEDNDSGTLCNSNGTACSTITIQDKVLILNRAMEPNKCNYELRLERS